jgi:hypothetical protein
MTSQTFAPDVLEHLGDPTTHEFRAGSRYGTLRAVRPLSPVPTFVGMAVVALGLAVIGIAWSRTAGEADVSRQVPYLISGGLFGLAMVLIGVTVVNIASKRRETVLREQQTRMLADAVDQLGRVLGDETSHLPR